METIVLYDEIMKEFRELEILKKECQRAVVLNDKEWLVDRLFDTLGVASSLVNHVDELRKKL